MGGSALWGRVAYQLGVVPSEIDEARAWPEIEALESEIERAFAVFMVLDARHSEIPFSLGPVVPKETCFALVPQFKIDRYRVDFVFAHSRHLDLRECVAVELDGHEWHEKTKEQARADKERDRYLQRYFGKVIHFTGSEVFDDVRECCSELMRVFMALHNHNPEDGQ
jgi:very-short-patch-repair endonuclease